MDATRLKFYIRRSFQDVCNAMGATYELLQIVGPPLLFFLIATADLEITTAMVNSGLAVEVNPTKQHFNDGISGVEWYSTSWFITLASITFLMFNVLYYTNRKYRPVVAVILFVLYIAVLVEAWTVLHNIFQLQQALAVLKATKVLQ